MIENYHFELVFLCFNPWINKMGNPFNNVYALLFIVVRVTIKFSEEKKYDMIKWQFQNV